MKATRTDEKFRPINLTIETEEELAIIFIAIGKFSSKDLVNIENLKDFYPASILRTAQLKSLANSSSVSDIISALKSVT